MGKFGFGKKSEGDDDSIKSSLFSRSKNKSPNPTPNPYAQPPNTSSNPYGQASAADPYSKPSTNGGAGGYDQPYTPPAVVGYGNNNSYPNPDSKSAGTASQYSGGYGSDRYGTQSGYGADRYGGTSLQEPKGSRFGAGGYGGLGSTTDNITLDGDRDTIYGASNKSKKPYEAGPPPYATNNGGTSGSSGTHGAMNNNAYGSSDPYGETSGVRGNGGGSSYEAYGDRQLTAEEEEEEDVQATKQEIRFLKQSDVSSTRNALRAAAMAEETGRGTLARIGAQGERIHNTEKNLDLTANHNSMAEEKAKELKRLNGSMFAIHPSNPFTAQKRREERDAQVMEKHRLERDQREASRKEAYSSDHRMQQNFKDLNLSDKQKEANKKSSLAERAKYQFEADDEDDEMENEIDANLDALSGAATRLNGLAKATGQELDEQNRHLRRLNEKSTAVDDQIAMNRARLDRFK